MLYNFTSVSHAVTPCDQLSSLDADPLSTAKFVKFSDLNAKTIDPCSEAISTSKNKMEEARFTLQRARGYFRAEEG